MDVAKRLADNGGSHSKIPKVEASIERADMILAGYKTFGYIPILSLGLLGNIVIIVYFIKINKKHFRKMSTYHFLIIILAIIDLVVILCGSILSIPLDENNDKNLNIDRYYYDDVLNIIKEGSTTASCWILVLLSYERYRSITHPFNRRLKKKYAMYLGIYLCVVCIMVHVPTPFLIHHSKDERLTNLGFAKTDFVIAKNGKMIPIIITSVCLDCVLPSMALAFLYWKIYKHLTENVLVIQPIVSSTENKATSPPSLSVNCRRRNTHTSATKTIRNLVILYVCLVWPSRILYIALFLIAQYNIMFYQDNYLLLKVLGETSHLLEILNNVVNVFVYGIMINGFRSFLWRLICCDRK